MRIKVTNVFWHIVVYGRDKLISFLWKTVAQSCLTLCNPMDCILPGSSVHGIFQARILKWVAFPFSRGSSQPRDRTQVSWITGGFFIIWAPREVQEYWSGLAYPFSRGSSQPRNRTRISYIAGGFFTSWATREAQKTLYIGLKGKEIHFYRTPCGLVRKAGAFGIVICCCLAVNSVQLFYNP